MICAITKRELPYNIKHHSIQQLYVYSEANLYPLMSMLSFGATRLRVVINSSEVNELAVNKSITSHK